MSSPTTGINHRVTVSLPDLFKSFLVVKPELDSNYGSVKDESEKWLQRWAHGASVTVAYGVSDRYQHNGTLREAEQEGQLLRLHIHGLRPCPKCPAREAQDCRRLGQLGESDNTVTHTLYADLVFISRSSCLMTVSEASKQPRHRLTLGVISV